MLLLSCILAVAAVAAAAGEASFVSVGDWGGHALKEDDYAQNTLAVAAQMKTTAKALGAQFVIGTGDNFYWCGIQNTSDYQVGGCAWAWELRSSHVHPAKPTHPPGYLVWDRSLD